MAAALQEAPYGLPAVEVAQGQRETVLVFCRVGNGFAHFIIFFPGFWSLGDAGFVQSALTVIGNIRGDVQRNGIKSILKGTLYAQGGAEESFFAANFFYKAGQFQQPAGSSKRLGITGAGYHNIGGIAGHNCSDDLVQSAGPGHNRHVDRYAGMSRFIIIG